MRGVHSDPVTGKAPLAVLRAGRTQEESDEVDTSLTLPPPGLWPWAGPCTAPQFPPLTWEVRATSWAGMVARIHWERCLAPGGASNRPLWLLVRLCAC